MSKLDEANSYVRKDVLIMKNENKLLTRDYISIGVFSLIYFVVAFVIGGLAQMTPVTFPFMPMIVALFAGSIFLYGILPILQVREYNLRILCPQNSKV